MDIHSPRMDMLSSCWAGYTPDTIHCTVPNIKDTTLPLQELTHGSLVNLWTITLSLRYALRRGPPVPTTAMKEYKWLSHQCKLSDNKGNNITIFTVYKNTRFSASGFFHESVSPRPPSIPLGPFWIFSKIRGDIREWIFIAGVGDTGDKLLSGVNDTGD